MPQPLQLACRPEQFAGEWYCDVAMLDAYEAAVRDILAHGKLMEVAQESALLAQQAEDAGWKGYELENGVAKVEVSGLLTKYPSTFRSRLGGFSYHEISKICHNLQNESGLTGVVFNMDTGGGLANGLDVACADIAKLRSKVPVVVNMHGGCMSAGYRIACEGDHIVADPSSPVGSIGAIMRSRNIVDHLKQAGIVDYHFASGDHKLDGGPSVPMTDERKGRIQSLANQSGGRFAEAVFERRKISDANKSTIRQAGVYWAPQAKALGLVDSIGFTTDAMAVLQNLIAARKTGQTGAANPQPHPAPEQRSNTMLTAEQLAAAKLLPGCSAITAENAGTVLMAALVASHATAQSRFDANELLATQLTDTNAKLKTAQTNQAKQQAPEVTAAYAAVAKSLMTPLKGVNLSPACVEKLQMVLVGAPDASLAKPEGFIAAALTPDATGNTIAANVIAALATNVGTFKADATQKTESPTAPKEGSEGAPGANWQAEAEAFGRKQAAMYDGTPVAATAKA